MLRKRFTVIGGRMSFLNVDYSVVTNTEELYDYTDIELLEAVENIRFANKQIESESQVFLRYLTKMEPSLLSGVDSDPAISSYLKKTCKQTGDDNQEDETSDTSKTSLGGKIRSTMGLKLLQTQSIRNLGSRASLLAMDRGPKININIKSDMVDKEMDILLEEIENLKAKTTCVLDSLRYSTEESLHMLKDIMDSRKLLEYDVCIKGANPVSGKIPPEKWLRYMFNWTHHTDSRINKLRLKNVTSREYLARANKNILEKQELVKSLTPIDFEQLKIKNRILKKTYETKTVHVYNLKRSSGKTNLQLTYHKNSMHGQMKELTLLKELIEKRKKKIADLNKKKLCTEDEVKQAKQEYIDLKLTTAKYEVSSIRNYAEMKKMLFEMKQNLKKWNTQSEVQKIALKTCLGTLKRLTKTVLKNK